MMGTDGLLAACTGVGKSGGNGLRGATWRAFFDHVAAFFGRVAGFIDATWRPFQTTWRPFLAVWQALLMLRGGLSQTVWRAF